MARRLVIGRLGRRMQRCGAGSTPAIAAGSRTADVSRLRMPAVALQ